MGAVVGNSTDDDRSDAAAGGRVVSMARRSKSRLAAACLLAPLISAAVAASAVPRSRCNLRGIVSASTRELCVERFSRSSVRSSLSDFIARTRFSRPTSTSRLMAATSKASPPQAWSIFTSRRNSSRWRRRLRSPSSRKVRAAEIRCGDRGMMLSTGLGSELARSGRILILPIFPTLA